MNSASPSSQARAVFSLYAVVLVGLVASLAVPAPIAMIICGVCSLIVAGFAWWGRRLGPAYLTMCLLFILTVGIARVAFIWMSGWLSVTL